MSKQQGEVREVSAQYRVELAEAADVPKGYKRTEVGMIPEDWDAVQLGGAMEMLTGFPFPSSGFSSGGIRLLRGSNVKRGELDWSGDLTKYWPKVKGDVAKYVLREGDVVIAMDGALVGRSYAVVRSQDLPSLLVQRVARIRSKALDQQLLAMWVGSDAFVAYVDSVKTHTAIPHISPGDIRNFPIAIPSAKAEQRAIATALSDVDALIAALDKLIAKKRAIKTAAMQQLLTGKQRLPGFTGEWEVKRLGEVGNFLKGSGVTRDEANSGNIPCVRYGEIYTVHGDIIQDLYSNISEEVAAKATRLFKGDILFAGSGETKEEIGKCTAFESDQKAYAGGDIVILRPKKIDSKYLGYLLNTPKMQKQKSAMGQGDAVVHISAKALAGIRVSLPPVEEQTAIAQILSDMDAEITALEKRRAKTRAIKQGMMQELLTGRTRLV